MMHPPLKHTSRNAREKRKTPSCREFNSALNGACFIKKFLAVLILRHEKEIQLQKFQLFANMHSQQLTWHISLSTALLNTKTKVVIDPGVAVYRIANILMCQSSFWTIIGAKSFFDHFHWIRLPNLAFSGFKPRFSRWIMAGLIVRPIFIILRLKNLLAFAPSSLQLAE